MKLNLSVPAVIIIIAIAFSSCTKGNYEQGDDTRAARVTSSRVSCGANCSAEAWLLSLDESTVYEPLNLPESFKIHELKVDVVLRKRPLAGISGNPAVELISIRAR